MNNKKIGILTFHNAHNYGAVLQAYALKTKLNQMGYEASVLNYRNKYIARNYRKILHIDFWKRDVLPFYWGKDIKEIWNVFYGLTEWQRRWNKFETFIDEQVLSETDARGRRNLSDVEKSDCDIYILGSDQIWCRELTHGFDCAYFGRFSSDKPKISYAASVANASIPEIEKTYFKEYMKNLTYISVREEKLAVSLAQLTQRDVETVIDPTLLLKKEDYYMLLPEKPLVQEPYILVYYVVENDVLAQYAKRTSERFGLRLIEIHFEKTPKLDKRKKEIRGTMVYDAGPKEFLTYIRDAQIVLTNSFHGTVFSILFEKNFYSVYQENERIQNLLDYLGLEKRHIWQEDEPDFARSIDYKQSDAKMKEYRRKSENYLERTLKTGE